MTGVKCINKILLCFSALFLAASFTGCGNKRVDMPYQSLGAGSPFVYGQAGGTKAEPFSTGLCIVEKNNDKNLGQEPSEPADPVPGQEQAAEGSNGAPGEAKEPSGGTSEEKADKPYASAALFDVNRSRVIYCEDAFERLYPASMTKVMTAILVMKYCQKEEVVTCSQSVKITEDGAQLMGLSEGDTLTMDQAMHALLMYSANDAAVAIAEHIAGSVEEFAKLMNEEARMLGAQGTNFKNPHGLHDDEHYTTAYDMYLMFNEATKHDWFNNIISQKEYVSNYKGADGSVKEMNFTSTNLYIKGDQGAPEGISVVGGKTGTTRAAGNNLVLLSRDGAGSPYISVMMRVRERGVLYSLTTELLKKI